MTRLVVQCLVSPPLETNSYILAEPQSRRAVIVDPSFVGDEILSRVRGQGWALDAVVLTHGHIDHTHDAAALARETNAPLLAHRGDETLMSDPILSGADWLDIPFDPCRITRFLEDEDEIEVGEARLRVLHAPGHSPGSICLLTPHECLTGDLLFRRGVGRWDLPGGDAAALRQSIRRLAALCSNDFVLYPGHGASSTMGDERRANPYLLDWLTG